MSARALTLLGLGALLLASEARAKKITLNPSDQTSNPVAGGGNEAQFALINAKLAKTILEDHGHTVTVDQDFYNAPKNANSWGADIFISVHTNAGGGHGTETLYLSSSGKTLADHVQGGLLGALPYQSRGLKVRTDLHVLNATNMVACLTECLFHDCGNGSSYQGHPPSEASFLKSADGQKKIAEGLAAGACAYFGTTCNTVAPPPRSTGFLKGSVYRAPNLNERIPGAAIKLSSGKSAKADAKGEWSFELAPGAYTVSASAPGYQDGSAQGTVTAGKDTWASVGLTPEAARPADAGVDLPPTAVDGAPLEDVRLAEHAAGGARPGEGCGCALTGTAPVDALPLALALVVLLARRRRGSRGSPRSHPSPTA